MPCGCILGQDLFVKGTSCCFCLLNMLILAEGKHDTAEHDAWGLGVDDVLS